MADDLRQKQHFLINKSNHSQTFEEGDFIRGQSNVNRTEWHTFFVQIRLSKFLEYFPQCWYFLFKFLDLLF